jgi:putative phage-type endonuclease
MIEQGSQEWLALRAGKVTASKVSDVMSAITTAGYRNYLADLVVERLTGNKTESFTNAAMQWGVDQEPLARAEYEVKTGNFVDQIAFVEHPTIANFGCSPDGLVGDDGLIEIKCPNTATHIDYVMQDKVPTKYIPQIQCQLAVTGRKWCDFVSFDPRLPDGLQILIVRLERDDEYIEKLQDRVVKFLDEVNSAVNGLKEKMK